MRIKISEKPFVVLNFFSKMSSNKEEINSQDAGKLKNFSTKS